MEALRQNPHQGFLSTINLTSFWLLLSSTSFRLLLKNYLNNADMFINGKYLAVKALNTYRCEFSHYSVLISALSLNAGPEVTRKLALTKGQLLWAR